MGGVQEVGGERTGSGNRATIRKEMQNLNFSHVLDAFVLHFQKLEPKMLFKSDLNLVSSEISSE